MSRELDADPVAELYADAVAVLSGWTPPGPADASARERTLALLRAGRQPA